MQFSSPSFALHAVAGQEVPPLAQSCATSLMSEGPSSAVGALHVAYQEENRLLPPKIIAFNDSLRELADLPDITSTDLAAAFPRAPVFLNKDTAAMFAAGQQRCGVILDSFLRGVISSARTYKLVVSVTGRLKKVMKEMWAVQYRDGGCDFIIRIRVLPDDFIFPSDLQSANAQSPAVRVRNLSESGLLFHWKSTERRAKASGCAFACRSCGATQTTQRRCALHTIFFRTN